MSHRLFIVLGSILSLCIAKKVPSLTWMCRKLDDWRTLNRRQRSCQQHLLNKLLCSLVQTFICGCIFLDYDVWGFFIQTKIKQLKSFISRRILEFEFNFFTFLRNVWKRGIKQLSKLIQLVKYKKKVQFGWLVSCFYYVSGWPS